MNSLNLNMLQSLKPFQCPSCNSWFSSKEAARHNVTRFPRILPCYHSVCENCLNSAVRNETFSCPICKESADLSDGGIAKLQPDVHSLGILSVNMKNSLPSIKTRFMQPSALKKNQSQDSLKNLVTALTCQRCHKNEALWQCDECQLNFCSICYGDVHSDMKLKKKHEAKKIFAELYNTMVQEGCPEHENKLVEFYCEVDDQLTCSHCMLIGNHVGHKVKTLLDKNKSCAASLQLVLSDVTKMQRQLKYTDHLICDVLPKEKIDTSHLFSEIHEYFHRLHALLQIRESELINELSEISESNITPLENMRLKVTSYERDLAAAKKDAEAVIENPCLAISAPALLKKLEECTNLPCHLVPVSVSDDNAKYVSIDLDLNTELEDQIKKFGSLKCNAKPKYNLLSVNDLPSDFTPIQIPESFDSNAQELESCATSVDNFSEDSLSVNSSLSSMQASFKCRDFSRRQPERVSVTHIKSPSSFFVQKFIDAKRLRALSEGMNRYCRQNDNKRNRPSELIPGDLYLVKYTADNQWYRGRVLSISDSDQSDDEHFIGKKVLMVTSGGKVIVKEKDVRAIVYYIDFGNTEIVSMQNIRNIMPRFLQSPSFAQECSLVDINPVHGNEWSEECVKTFAKLVQNKSLIMQVYEERNNVYAVDLCQAADNEIVSDVPVSVRDMLVFLELAVFPSGIKTVPNMKRNKNLRNYMPPESLRVNANIWAIVSHVVDPYHFYVQQMSTASYLSKIIYELNETYNKDTNPMLHSIYVPYIGLICAAQFSLDKQWYRAEVIGLPGGAKVEVRYVDFGNTEIIHHKSLRKLFDQFLKLNIQAIPCRLAHVSYNQEKCWSSEAKEWLTKEVSSKQLTVKSLGTIPGTNKSEVVIYYSDDAYDICVNSLMVEKGFATATGPFGSAEVRVRKEIPPPKENLITNVVSTNFLPTHDNIIKSPVPPKETIPPPVNNIKSPTHKPKYPTLAPPPANKDKEYIEVHVSHVQTPGCFYIRIAGDMETKLNALMKEMQKVYENFEGEVIDCTVGKAYAVYNTKEKRWLRGTVTSKSDNDIVNVHYVDYGGDDKVSRKDLRKLMDQFTKDDAFSIRCHLEGIIPTGGSEQWPRTACDALQRIVDQCEILLLLFKGEPEKDSLPADLYIEHLIQGGALEPTKLEYISISEEIVKNGLGLPVRKKRDAKIDITPPESPVLKNDDETKTDKTVKSPEKCDSEKPPSDTSKSECIVSEKCKAESKVIEPPTVITVTEPPKPREPKFQWKPAVIPLESTFRAFVTNIGEDGSIHLYVLKEGNSQVDMIKKALQFKFSKGRYEPLKEPPPVGEACIAKFSVDECWYRAEVLNIYPEKIKVNFVDYGNNELVQLKDIRPEIIMQTFARQCLECSLHGLEESFKWDNAVCDFVHKQLVETEVDVEVMGPSNNGKLPCRIKMLSGMDISDLLLSMGFDSSYDEEELAKLSVSQTGLDEFKAFTAAKEWREGDVYPVCITQVPSPCIVYLQQLKFQNPKEDYEVEHNQVHEAFLQMIAELRDKADSFPKLKEPLPGMPCCAKYSYDGNWYRCEVTDLTENGVIVLYVDYGNTEVVSPDNLRELENSYIEFPVQVYFCELHGVKPNGAEWDLSVHKKMMKKLLNPDQEYEAKVVNSGKILEIDIFTKVDEQYRLVYGDLVEESLIILDK